MTQDSNRGRPEADNGDAEKTVHLNTAESNRSDAEAQKPLPNTETDKPEEPKDPFLVTWTGPDDPEAPRNWRVRRKWAAILIVSMFTFISPVTSSMVAPALPIIGKDLHVSGSFEQDMILSVFVLGYAVGPLVLGPCSEVFGRMHVLQIANSVFLAFNIGCGFAQTKSQMIAFRFMCGLGGAAPMALGGGILGDLFDAEHRGRAMTLYVAGPLLGPALGPIAGGFIAENTTWRWVFWSTASYNALVQIVGLFLLRETYAPVLLSRRATALRKSSNDSRYHSTHDRTVSLKRTLGIALQRPFILLFTQPIIIILAIFQAYIYGLMYIILTTFPMIWSDVYHESIGIGGLNYIALGLGFAVGIQVAGPLVDKIYIRLKRRNNNVGRPEFRVPLMLPASLLTITGIMCYAWTTEFHTHWIGPDISIFIFAMGTIVTFQCNQTYIVDAYTRYASSAMSAVTVLRSLAGFGFPLFAPAMYKALGLGWGNSLLGFIAIGIGVPTPLIFWFYGERLRAVSGFAAGGDTAG